MNISECDAVDSKTFMQFPDKETISMTDEEIKERFDDGYFEYVRTVPSMIYKLIIHYDTPTARAYDGMEILLDRITNFMASEPITVGKDGSANTLLKVAKDFDSIRQSFKGVKKDLQEEQAQQRAKGGQQLAYDQL